MKNPARFFFIQNSAQSLEQSLSVISSS